MQALRMERQRQADRMPLFVRASLPRTFLGLGTFVEVGLMFVGSYLLIDAIASPLEASQSAVLFGAAILAVAIILFFYMARPIRRRALAQRPRAATGVRRVPPPQLKGTLIRQLDAPDALERNKVLPGPM